MSLKIFMRNKYIHLCILHLIFGYALFAQTDPVKSCMPEALIPATEFITFDKEEVCNGKYEREIRPYNFQLYPRKADNMGSVKIAGTIAGCENLTFCVNKKLLDQSETLAYYPLYIEPYGHFSIEISIHAELAEYNISYSSNGIDWIIIASKVVCGDAYVVSGQSNAVAGSDPEHDELINLRYGNSSENQYGKYSRTYKNYNINPNSGWGNSEVGGTIGFGVGIWGLKLQYELEKELRVPICLINGAVGGTGMDQHHIFEQDPFYYIDSPPQYLFGSLLTRVYYSGLENYIKAIIWFNGEDECSSANPETGIYTRDFDSLYNSCVEYLGSFRQMYVIQIASYTGPDAGIGFVSEDQRELPAYYDRLKVMSSNGIGLKNPGEGQHIHFTAEAYEVLGQRMFNLIERDIYGNTLVDNPEPPNILKARKEGNRIFLDFDQILDIYYSDPLDNVLSVIQFDVPAIAKYNAGIEGNSLFFDVDSSYQSLITLVSYAGYLPNNDYDLKCYLRNSDSIAALSFYNFLITEGENPISVVSNSIPSSDISLSPNPCRDVAHIKLSEGCGESRIQLFNFSGKLLVQDVFSGNDYKLDCSNFNPGIYILHIISKCGYAELKVVVL